MQVAHLLKGADTPIVVITAPAGGGKTTTARLWEEADTRRFVWVDVTVAHNDASLLCDDIAAALELQTTGARSLPAGDVATLSSRLAQAHPVVLVLDGAHVLTDEQSVRCIDGLVSEIPRGSQIVLLGRTAPTLSLARRRLSDEVLEMDSVDLVFAAEDIEAVLSHAGLEQDETTVGDISSQTEGWPAGVHLAVQHLQRRDGIGSLSPRDPALAEYFSEEVFDDLPDDVMRFLEFSAVLGEFTPDLLDEFLERSDSGQMLEMVEHTVGSFLVRLDLEGQSYRYHRLFDEALLARLETSDPHAMRRLHSRASQLLSRHEDLDGALHHALAAGEVERAANLIAVNAVPIVFEGHAELLGRWLSRLPADAIDRYPGAAIAQAWQGLGTGDHPAVAAACTAAARFGWHGPLMDGSPSVSVALAMVRAFVGADGVAGVLRDSEEVRAGGGPLWNPWWGLATMVQGTALAMIGEPQLARERLTESLPAVMNVPAFEAAVYAHLALLDLHEKDLKAAKAHADAAMRIADAHALDRVAAAVSVFEVAALVNALTGDREVAERTAAVANALLVQLGDLSPRTHLLGNILLAETSLALGKRAEAKEYVEAAERVRIRDPSATTLHERLDSIARQMAEGSDLDLTEIDPLTPAELRFLTHLTSHLNLQQIADEVHVSRNTAKTHSLAIYRKLGVSSRSEAVAEARRLGLLAT